MPRIHHMSLVLAAHVRRPAKRYPLERNVRLIRQEALINCKRFPVRKDKVSASLYGLRCPSLNRLDQVALARAMARLASRVNAAKQRFPN